MTDDSLERSSLRQLHPHRWDIPLLTLLAAVLLIVGQSTPTMRVEELWGIKKDTFTIWTGIQMMLQNHYYFLGSIIFLFSVVFPYAKLIAIMVLWFKRFSPEDRVTMTRWLGVMGKWSMLDVFVVAVFIVVTEAAMFVKAHALYGIYIFGTSIAVSIVVSMLIEQIAEKEKEKYLIAKGRAGGGDRNLLPHIPIDIEYLQSKRGSQ